jgi:SNF2 family DNA or RNA helicase
MLALVTKLKQLCNYEPDSGASAKLEALQMLTGELTDESEKLVVFSQYVQTLEWLSQRLEIPHEIYHGGLSEQERDVVLERFRERPGPRALLMSLRAGGLGLNLQIGTVVVLFDRWWNPAVERQAIERAHRFGRDRPLHVLKFIVADSIEERIAEILKAKEVIFEQYVEDAENAVVQPFGTRELYRLLRVVGAGDTEELGTQHEIDGGTNG